MNKSFARVFIVWTVPLVFVVHPDVEAEIVSDLIELTKVPPCKLAFATAGHGSPQYLAAEMFKRLAGVEVQHVPYKEGPAMVDLTVGQVQAIIETAPAAHAHVKSGKLRALATTTGAVASLQGVPNTALAGLPSFEVRSVFGILAPAGTSQAVINKLNALLKAILAEDDVREQLLVRSADAAHTTPAEAAQAIQAESAK